MRRSTATAALDHCTGDHAWKEKSGFILLEEESSECMVDDGLMGVFFFLLLNLCVQDVEWLKSITSLPILLKGIVTAEDGNE